MKIFRQRPSTAHMFLIPRSEFINACPTSPLHNNFLPGDIGFVYGISVPYVAILFNSLLTRFIIVYRIALTINYLDACINVQAYCLLKFSYSVSLLKILSLSLSLCLLIFFSTMSSLADPLLNLIESSPSFEDESSPMNGTFV